MTDKDVIPDETQLDPETIYAMAKRMSPEAQALMKQATQMSQIRLERWISEPKHEPLTHKEMDVLDGWFRGEFVQRSTRNGYVRVRIGANDPVQVGWARTPRPKRSTHDYEADGFKAMPMVPATRSGKDLPTPEQSKLDALKAEEARRAADVPKRNRVVEVLKNPWR